MFLQKISIYDKKMTTLEMILMLALIIACLFAAFLYLLLTDTRRILHLRENDIQMELQKMYVLASQLLGDRLQSKTRKSLVIYLLTGMRRLKCKYGAYAKASAAQD